MGRSLPGKKEEACGKALGRERMWPTYKIEHLVCTIQGIYQKGPKSKNKNKNRQPRQNKTRLVVLLNARREYVPLKQRAMPQGPSISLLCACLMLSCRPTLHHRSTELTSRQIFFLDYPFFFFLNSCIQCLEMFLWVTDIVCLIFSFRSVGGRSPQPRLPEQDTGNMKHLKQECSSLLSTLGRGLEGECQWGATTIPPVPASLWVSLAPL